MYRPLTLKNVSERYTADNEYHFFGQFLDDFRNEKSDKYALIADEPIASCNMSQVFQCMLAAAAHKLANDNNLSVPEWVFNNKYVLNNAYYAFNTKIREYQNHLKETSPDEYKQRNPFMGDSVLSRV
jgi:hypothetical protein